MALHVFTIASRAQKHCDFDIQRCNIVPIGIKLRDVGWIFIAKTGVIILNMIPFRIHHDWNKQHITYGTVNTAVVILCQSLTIFKLRYSIMMQFYGFIQN